MRFEPRSPAERSSRSVVVALALLLLSAAAPLDRIAAYHNALAALPRPSYVEYDYVQTRSGPDHVVTEQHRVYRTQSGQERNDTIMVNGTPVVPAISRILRRDSWPYDIAQFALSSDDYDIVPAGIALVSGRKAYSFRTTRHEDSGFRITGLYLDPRRSLPVRETFAVAGASCAGTGVIDFAPASRYWLPTAVQVNCTAATANGPAVFKESIRFANYGFPNVIPADVFTAAGETATPTP